MLVSPFLAVSDKALAVGNGSCYFLSILLGLCPLENTGRDTDATWAPSMTIIHVRNCSLPSDPETELKDFRRRQAEYESAYRRTGEPLALYEALLHARASCQQLPADLDWLVKAVCDVILRDRTDQTVERFQQRMRHVRRYRCVRDLRRSNPKDRALGLAVAALEAAGEAVARSTIEDSYDRVNRDLKRAGRESEYFLLVARGEPTVIMCPPGGSRKSNDQGG
jgi:hypothetical protein